MTYDIVQDYKKTKILTVFGVSMNYFVFSKIWRFRFDYHSLSLALYVSDWLIGYTKRRVR
jgi:hypothetical protein